MPLPGRLDRDLGGEVVISRLGAGRSVWNAADVRGEVEQLLACAGLVADSAARGELVEDLTARAVARCVALTDAAVPEHVRALSSRRVLDVEADLIARLAARGAVPVDPEDLLAPLIAAEGLDERWVSLSDAEEFAHAVAARAELHADLLDADLHPPALSPRALLDQL